MLSIFIFFALFLSSSLSFFSDDFGSGSSGDEPAAFSCDVNEPQISFSLSLNCYYPYDETICCSLFHLLCYFANETLIIGTEMVPVTHDCNGGNFLHALFEGRQQSTSIIEWLLRHNFDQLEERDNNGMTPVMIAIRNDLYNATVNLCDNYGADLIVSNNELKTAFHLAQSVRMLRFLFAMTLTPITAINTVDKDGRTPLLVAVKEKKNYPTVSFLLQIGSSLNERDNDGKMAIHYAVANEDLKTVKMLLRKGADSLKRDQNGKTSIRSAIEMKNLEIAKVLLSNQTIQALHLAVETNFTEFVRFLCFNDFEFFKAMSLLKNNQGLTPLMHAVEIGNREIIEMLIEASDGEIINQNSNGDLYHGDSVLHLALRNNDFDTVELLMQKHDIQLQVVNNFKETTCHLAVIENVTFALEKMAMERNECLVKRDVEGLTPLLRAFEIDNIKAIEILSNINQHSSLNLQVPGSEDSPLHLAVRRNQNEIVQILLENGANASTLNSVGNSPLHESIIIQDHDTEIPSIFILNRQGFAAKNGFKRNLFHLLVRNTDFDREIGEMLMNNTDEDEKIAMLNEADRLGDTPLHRAISHENTDVAELYLKNGARCDLLDRSGRSAVELAIESGYTYMIVIFRHFPHCPVSGFIYDDDGLVETKVPVRNLVSGPGIARRLNADILPTLTIAKKFFMVAGEFSISVAKELCERRHKGAKLAAIRSKSEHDFICEAMKELLWQRAWIGLRRSVPRSTLRRFRYRLRFPGTSNWVWPDGSHAKFKAWLPKEPGNYEDIVQIRRLLTDVCL